MPTRHPKNIVLLKQFAADFDQYVRETFGYKQACVNLNGDTLCVNRRKADLYLRFRTQVHLGPKTVVIARIGFVSQRAGYGTSLLRFLVRVSAKYGYTYIGVEGAHLGKNIQSFLRKYGFESIDGSNWAVSVTVLADHLVNRPLPVDTAMAQPSGENTWPQ